MKKQNLNELLKEGFVTTNKYYSTLEIYKKKDIRALYDTKKDIVWMRYKSEERSPESRYKRK